MTTTRKILAAIKEDGLTLGKGHGYWYFTFDREGFEFGERVVMVTFLNDLSIDQWVEEGRDLVAKCAPKVKEAYVRIKIIARAH